MTKKEISLEKVPGENTNEIIEEVKPAPKKEFSVEDLPGVGAATAEKLKEAGFGTLLSIAVASPGEITESANVGEAMAKKIINAARNKLDMGFTSGKDLLKKAESVERIDTGSKELNMLLGGGVETGTITEMYGAFASGKSQIAHQLAVAAQLPKEKGGLNGSVIFIDTESTFRPQRIKQICEGMGLDSTNVLSKIKVARAFNSDHQMLLAEKVGELIANNNEPIKLIIVDSMMALFRSEYIGRGTLSDRQQKLNKHIHVLQRLADMYNIAVYVTNQVMAKPDTLFGDPTVPVGGNIVGHGMNPRIYLRKGKSGTRVAKLVDSSYLPEKEVLFRITEEGIKDVKEKD